MNAIGYLYQDPDSLVRKKMKFRSTAPDDPIQSSGKSCNTLLRAVKIGNIISQLEAIPKTGRSHQIRATLYSMGYPVVGDKIYGVDDRLFIRFINGTLDKHDKKRLRISRQALHSAELQIMHPETGNRLSFKAPVPSDMKTLLLLH